MTARNKETVVYYDFNDVLACSVVSSSAASMSMDEGEQHEGAKGTRRSSLREASSSTTTTSSTRCLPFSPSPPPQAARFLDFHRLDNVEHWWDNKPFVVQTIRTMCGPSHMKTNKLIQYTRARLMKAGCWGGSSGGNNGSGGLVLTDGSNPFQSKLYFAVHNVAHLPCHCGKLRFLSGLWISKVFVGHNENLVGWIDAMEAEIREMYPHTRPSAQQWFAYYPTFTSRSSSSSNPSLCYYQARHSVVTFFIKVTA